MTKTRKLVRLIHNPGAGEGKGHTKKEMISLIEDSGYKCDYVSSKGNPLKGIKPETEFIAIAGGDGTIRQTIMKLLDKKLKYKRPIALLPFGTANNLATSLGISTNAKDTISSWSSYNLKKFDVGQALGMKDEVFFIESFGFGLFPRLMADLKAKNTDHITTPEDEFKMALEELLEITRTYPAVPVKVEVNDEVLELQCILVEVMNISSMGPHLVFSQKADPGDGLFDLVMVRDDQRGLMESYITKLLKKQKPKFPIEPINAKKITINWVGKDVHADDEVITNYKPSKVKISLLDSLLEVVIDK
jgi:diacylglycerol kinase (ATP)